MKITIDTQVDTYEDVQKVVHILTQILERKGETVSRGESVDTTNLMGMFGDGGTSPDLGNFLTKQEKRAERPQVEIY